MILLESQKSLMFLLTSSECRNAHSASALAQRDGTKKKKKNKKRRVVISHVPRLLVCSKTVL